MLLRKRQNQVLKLLLNLNQVATLKNVSEDILKQLALTSQVGRVVGSDLFTLTKKRIFTDGIASDGASIGTYSPVTVSIKKSKGRFTSKEVNLRDTETLANSYTFEGKGDSAEIGFRGATKNGVSNAEKIKKIEQRYGDVFGLTSKEEGEIDNIIDDFVDRIYK